MNENTTNWRPREREALKHIIDMLIPGGAGMPPASEAETLSNTDRVSKYNPELARETKTLISKIDVMNERSIQDIKNRYPEHFASVSEMTARAYFLDTSVTQTLNYQDRPTIPLDDEATRVKELQKLVAPVAERGNVWRTSA